MIYLDNASTTKIDPEVLEAMMPYLTDYYGNPGGRYGLGRKSKEAVENARKSVAKFIGAEPSQIVFTGSGTEANNLALKMAKNLQKSSKNVIISSIEHDSVRKSAEILNIKHAFYVDVLNVDNNGILLEEDLYSKITDETSLVSVMHVNNEIGSKSNPKLISRICKSHGALYHSDCVQAAGCTYINVKEFDFDMLSMSAHKIHGPKGVGCLYVRDKKILEPLISGGDHQEFGLRGGTENVAGIVGFGKACDLIQSSEVARISSMKQKFYERMVEHANELGVGDFIHDNASSGTTHGKTLSVRFDNVDAETLVLLLSTKGVCVSAGSACRSLEQKPSHVLTAIGLTPEMARNTIRISFSKDNDIKEDIVAADIIVDAAYSLYKLAC